ncbi:RNA polymerase subunit sigma-24 [Paenibacillus brevis]|uniref:RNA polymerase subunit sigma-24 n=1 Tax=Paenibacillus brevis TaxID=2841508 RepID=A0ABS6FJT6_9BACL|nr:RNA polymerase subunit sigma-24 [Paenibacillus brevis]MBU5670264.1 RNA polymerase subunit sigma-24 [Paenibacillus brevis]
MAEKVPTIETRVIDQLSKYRELTGRIRILESYKIGAGMTVSRLNEDDQLQDLHRKLKGMPSYMYLNKHEQKLEQTAHAYLDRYPAGTRAQKRAIPLRGIDRADDKLLWEIRKKIQRVIDARGGCSSDLDDVLERVAELQELQDEKSEIDKILEVMSETHSHFAELLRLRYIQGMPVADVATELCIVPRTFDRWRPIAISKYGELAGMS